MSDFGDELIIESYKVTWLIWIQLFVMILLIILLFFGFSAFTSEPSTSSSANSAAAEQSPHLDNPRSSHGRAKEESQSRGDRVTSAELAIEEVQDGEESSSKDSSLFRIFRNPNHPCTYFGVAKRAFLKCLGLDCSSEHEKQE